MTLPRELIIGATGRIGSQLAASNPQATCTSRRAPDDHYYCDLLRPNFTVGLPPTDIIYLCAGLNGTMASAMQPLVAWHTNVDAPIALAQHAHATGAFLVLISSTTVMWMHDMYAEQRRQVEATLRLMPHIAIIRAGRVTSDNITELCQLMLRIGRQRTQGLVTWNEDEVPYTFAKSQGAL